MEIKAPTTDIRDLINDFKCILKDDILLSNESRKTSYSNVCHLDFQLGCKNKDDTKEIYKKEYPTGFDEEDKYYKQHYGLDSKEWKRNLWEIHPGDMSLIELSETMKAVSVPGLDNTAYTKGIKGAIEGVDFGTNSNHKDGGIVLENSLVWVHFALFLEGEQTPFDSSIERRKGKPEVLIASPRSIIHGLAAAIRWLKIGQRGRFIMPPSTYGQLGLFETVPPDTSVLLLLHVIRALDAGALLRYDEFNEICKKDFGNVKYYVGVAHEVAKDCFFRKKISESIDVYKKSLDMLTACDRNKSNNEAIDELLLKTYINLSLSLMRDRKRDFHSALNYLDCASHLQLYETNCKAQFLTGKCHLLLSNYDEAQEYLMKALKLEPNNEKIGEELENLEQILNKSKSVQKTIGKKYLNRDTELDERQIKLRECLISRQDIDKIKLCVRALGVTHRPVLPDVGPLMNEEKVLINNLSINYNFDKFYVAK